MPETYSLRHFAKHLFLVSNVYMKRRKAEQEVYEHLKSMRQAIIKMRLGYSHIDKLKEKIANMVEQERSYARILRPEDGHTRELRSRLEALESELQNERESKQKIIKDTNEKTSQLAESLESTKMHAKNLLLEKAQRQQRLRHLEKKINERVDLNNYYNS